METIFEILAGYEPLYLSTSVDFGSIGSDSLPLPIISKDYFQILCQKTIDVLVQEPVLLTLEGQYIIVGDIHGNIRDLIRIFAHAGNPNCSKYVFLGDYVDRGEFSIEVIVLLFVLKVMYPENVYLLRGNHEFRDINSQYGLKDQVMEYYGRDVFELINLTFSYLPLAANIGGHTFLVHGGLGPSYSCLEDIKKIKKGCSDYSNTNYEEIVNDMMWSDPCENSPTYTENKRCRGHMFGCEALHQFLEKEHFTRLIRGHQCVIDGVLQEFNRACITVFSSSNYKRGASNSAGVIILNRDGTALAYNFEPLVQIPKEETKTKLIGFDNFKVLPRRSSMLKKYSGDFSSMCASSKLKKHGSMIIEPKGHVLQKMTVNPLRSSNKLRLPVKNPFCVQKPLLASLPSSAPTHVLSSFIPSPVKAEQPIPE